MLSNFRATSDFCEKKVIEGYLWCNKYLKYLISSEPTKFQPEKQFINYVTTNKSDCSTNMLRNKFYLKMGGNLSSLVTYNVLKIDRFISFDKLVKLLFMAILFQRDDKFWHGVNTVTNDIFFCGNRKKKRFIFQSEKVSVLVLEIDFRLKKQDNQTIPEWIINM